MILENNGLYQFCYCPHSVLQIVMRKAQCVPDAMHSEFVEPPNKAMGIGHGAKCLERSSAGCCECPSGNPTHSHILTCRRTMQFVMPSKYTRETLPKPNNPNVQIREVAGHDVAASTWRWVL